VEKGTAVEAKLSSNAGTLLSTFFGQIPEPYNKSEKKFYEVVKSFI